MTLSTYVFTKLSISTKATATKLFCSSNHITLESSDLHRINEVANYIEFTAQK